MAERHADVPTGATFPGQVGLPHLARLRVDDHRAAQRLIAAAGLSHQRGPGALAVLDRPASRSLVARGVGPVRATAVADLHSGKPESLPIALLHQLNDERGHVDRAGDEAAADVEPRALVGNGRSLTPCLVA